MIKKRPQTKLLCWNCGHLLDDVPRPISRHEHCRECFEALHCCRLCRHYRSDINSRCNEDRADPPMNKENGNFCDYFRPDAGAFSARIPQRSEAAQTRLDGLFSAPDSESQAGTVQMEDSSESAQPGQSPERARTPEEQARNKLDSLFSKP